MKRLIFYLASEAVVLQRYVKEVEICKRTLTESSGNELGKKEVVNESLRREKHSSACSSALHIRIFSLGYESRCFQNILDHFISAQVMFC